MIIVVFFVAHWQLSVFFQTFYLHRYGAHKQFTMSHGWERFFHLCTYIVQGSSFLSPRAYAILHRMHHAYSDTPKDPHSPLNYKNVVTMMLATKKQYDDFAYRRVEPEARFEAGCPTGPRLTGSASRGSGASPGRGAYVALLRELRHRSVDVRAPSGPLRHGPDPWRHRQLVRPQVWLPELRQRRRVAEHPPVRLPHGRRALPEQPPQVRDEPELRGALVRDRPDATR